MPTLSRTQAAALNALQARKADGLARMHAAEHRAFGGMGLTKTERAEMIGDYLTTESFIAGQRIPGASYRTLRALVRSGACKTHRTADGKTIIYAA